jgi:ribosomal protein S6--L-glutamate ligase
MQQRIITSNNELFSCYHELVEGDIIIGRIRLAEGQEHLLLDLVSRGVELIPSAASQLCSRSKVYQAAILQEFMVRHTRSIYSVNDLLEAVTDYEHAGVGSVICKLDRANAGLGVLKFTNIEDVFSQASLGNFAFPFVLQPFVAGCKDVRVVMLGDIVEAYQRYNPNTFRHNLHCGGQSFQWELTAEQRRFCLQVMQRAGFLYAHVDLLILPDGRHRLSEINLRGGLRGAQINQQDYMAAVKKMHRRALEKQKKRG